MRKVSSQSYVDSFNISKPITDFGIGKVIQSKKDEVFLDDLLYVQELSFQEYNVLRPEHPARVIKEKPGVPLSVYIGVLGMPGMTAFYGLETIGKPVKGETIFVSSGATQLTKAKGLKVIAYVGSDEKIKFLEDIGVDVPFDYKTQSIADVLAKEGPIDIYWDNVGGSTLEPYVIKNATHILFKQLTVKGFFVLTGEKEYEGQLNNPIKFLGKLVPLVQSGQIKWSEQTLKGLDSAGEGVIAVQTGANTAKVVIEV
ncbi:NAD-P-binding protein, partial [Rhizoctonia solani]